MKRILFLAFLATSVANYAQTLTKESIEKYTSSFTVENNQIKGSGKKVIKKMINSAQFITYGETHGSKQVSILTKAFMPLLKKGGFKHFAIEVGPNSGKKLTELSNETSKTVTNLNKFNSAYTVSKEGQTAVPIPFFDAISDAEFLQEARKNGMQLWGIDQEFYFSSFFLFDEMMKTIKNDSNYKQILQKKGAAMQIMYKHFLDEFAKKNEGAYALIRKEKAVINFFNSFSKENTIAQTIINDLKISWDIYIRWRDDSHVDRISYMRNNFLKHYNQALKTERQPKVFTKIGSLHASKILSNGAFDIGHLTQELAEKNNTESVTINTWVPFHQTKDGLENNFEKYKRSYRRYSLFTHLADKNQWVIVNLKQIRNDISKGKTTLPTHGDYHKLKKLISGYDYLFIAPTDVDTTPNRS